MPIVYEHKVYDVCEYGYFDVEGMFHCPFAENYKESIDILMLESSVKHLGMCPKHKGMEDVICYRVKVKEE